MQPPSTATAAIVGQFTGKRQQEVVIARGSRLEMVQIDVETGRATRIMQQPLFGNTRSLSSVRVAGGQKDYVVFGSDAGRIVVAEYNNTTNRFERVHQETFGRSGNRRVVPGQFLAADPKGRAVIIGALERSKLIYILNRDPAGSLTISSPLEANRPSALFHSAVGVDVGYENPIFAVLEIDFGEADRDPTGAAAKHADKMLTYYELDLGLNHVVRRWSEPVDTRASHLIQVPGAYNHTSERWEGPSGVLVCTDDYIVYRHQGQQEHRVPIPRRYNPVGTRRPSMIVTSVLHRMKNAFFFLVQNEDGDLFKVSIDHDEEDMVALRIKYFETVPVATSLCILRAGFLYVASEFGAHHVYSFQKLGDDDDEEEHVSTDYVANGAAPDSPPPIPEFTPRVLGNIVRVDDSPALDPILGAVVSNAHGAEAPQLYAIHGRGARSSFRQLRHGLDVDEVVSSDLPGVPNAVWSTKLRNSDAYDSYIVLSFVNGTLVLSIGETIEEVTDSGFSTEVPTLSVQQLGADAILQVHPNGIRHILSNHRVNEWTTPISDGAHTTIVASTTNSRQAVVALNTGELVYFELDMDGQLNEFQERRALGAPVLALSIAEVPEGRQRTPYLAAACADFTVRIVSLDPANTLSTLSTQALTALPSSVCVAELLDVSVDRHHLAMFVHIGLQNGVHIRTVLDPVTGQLTDTRTRFLGNRAVRLVRSHVHGQPAVLALSTRSWLSYSYQSHVHFTPLIYEPLEHVSSFCAELCPDGLIGTVGGTLRIFTVPQLGGALKQDVLPLSYTPRRVAVHPNDPALFYVAEADHRVLSGAEANRRADALSDFPPRGERGILDADPREWGQIRADAGTWASTIRIVHGPSVSSVFALELGDDEAALSLALVPFASAAGEMHLVVGTAVGATVVPRSHRAAYIHTYRLADDGRSLELLHKTPVDDIPLVLRRFQGRMIAGIGNTLRIYELGKGRLLRKCELRHLPSSIVTLDVQGSRILVGDMSESILWVAYKHAANRLVVFADDTMPRWTMAAAMLDYDTVALGDRFGNLAVLRIDESASRYADEDPTGLSIMHDKPYLSGAPNKAQLIAHYHIGDMITSLVRTSLVPGGRQVLLYTGINGTLGAFVPFVSREDVDLLTKLELHMRQELPGLVGRTHLAYRGSYTPVKAVVDGDLCELYSTLHPDRQAQIAESLELTAAELNKKLAMLRESTVGI
ncbi:pre-mRNA-splicing factor rse1 [Malassezia cuniculi]|uniref:Pre-mRNA-splicing factor RSE1 n=1 Tax=Malassezia cuniculi TaxID=948313 RepID=A0AAF0F0G5_9BASI|nr:pre-mRNA-splicing factor rse1 [Malassezia cuniculi]